MGSSMITQAQPFPRTVVAGVDQVGHELRSVDTALLPQTLSSLPDGGSGLGTTKICLGSFSNCGVRSLEGNCAVSGATRYYCSVTSQRWLSCPLLSGFSHASCVPSALAVAIAASGAPPVRCAIVGRCDGPGRG